MAAKIEDFLSDSDVVIDFDSTDKKSLLKELAGPAARKLGLPAEAVSQAIAARDELGSTGIGGGVAIPHARFREITKPFGTLVRLKRPIAFEAIDGQQVDIVFLVLLPAHSQLDQLNALAAVARKLRDDEVLRKMRKAASSFELYQAVIG